MKIVYCGAVLLVIVMNSQALAVDTLAIAWNDLGMHCANRDFTTVVVLPPYNNIRIQVIQTGDASNLPVVITADLRVTYEIPGNTYSVGKTNFWDFEDQIFGVSLPDNIGLTGNALTGEMTRIENYFHADGIPITPFTDTDLLNEDPFQLGLLTVYDALDNPVTTAQPVIPVSNEINCVSTGCHPSEQNILDEHELAGGFDPGNTPILCASCHASNALGTTGQPGLESLSEVIHKQHGDKTDDCYKCHPGPQTQCLRDVMSNVHNMTCQDCHGSVTAVGESISSGREPWFEEPSCGSVACHGATYAEEPGRLFRESRGHGGLFCSACHGEPHAIVPSREARDNLQQVTLQGMVGTLRRCETCHGIVPAAPGPHGITGSTSCCNDDGIRGNVNGIASIDISDLTYLVAYEFKQGPEPPCLEEADVNASASLDIADVTYLVAFMFKSGQPPAACQ